MAWILDDIITAVASSPGGATRGIVRASGPNVQSTISADFHELNFCTTVRPASAEWMNSRKAGRFSGTLAVAGLRTPLPVDVYFWPDRQSFTGQPSLEIHAIGSPPILDAIVSTCVRRGARIARPGEFTLRAFLAGKIDLLQAEAVLGVIDSDSPADLRQALDQLSGGISSRLVKLRESLLLDLADLEAGLDFSEEDLEFVERAALRDRLRRGQEWVAQLLARGVSRARSGIRRQVVLAGLPNAGKSTLFNALGGRDRAIVSPGAGTTRDWLTTPVDLGGLLVDLIDTAGWDHSGEAISSAARVAAAEQFQRADLVVWCSAASLGQEERELDSAARAQLPAGRRALAIVTKQDQAPGLDESCSVCPVVSALTGKGLGELRGAIREALNDADRERGELLSTTSARAQMSLSTAGDALARAERLGADDGGEELIAFELRSALDALGEVAGVIYTDDLLDRIFSRFCIGK